MGQFILQVCKYGTAVRALPCQSFYRELWLISEEKVLKRIGNLGKRKVLAAFLASQIPTRHEDMLLAKLRVCNTVAALGFGTMPGRVIPRLIRGYTLGMRK